MLEEVQQQTSHFALACGRFMRAVARDKIARLVEETVGPRRGAVGPQVWSPAQPRRLDRSLARIEIQGRIPFELLLDEPLGALDPITRSDLQKDLRAAFQTLKKTVVLVTHDLAEAAYFADTVVLLEKGRIVQQGVLRDFVQRPASPFVTEFVESQRGPWEALREAVA